ncbi:MAG: hypothetical protein J6S59_03120 [Clostridia bacterium]|nr:hypothetical protein [Clostridia bacterium]
MSQHGTLFGVVLGAAIVGTTLIVRDALENPETAEAVHGKIKSGYQQIKSKVGEGYSFVKNKVQDGYTVAREKANAAGENIRYAVENDATVQKIRKKVQDIRRAAEPAEAYFADSEPVAENEGTDNDAEKVVEIEAGIRDAEEDTE